MKYSIQKTDKTKLIAAIQCYKYNKPFLAGGTYNTITGYTEREDSVVFELEPIHL